MTTWLKLLPLELQDITQFVEPFGETKRDENVAGVMSEDLKRLYTLWMSYQREAEQARLNYKYSAREEDKRTAVKNKFKADALERIFWCCVNEEFDLWDKGCTSVRTGWQVCWAERSSDDFPPFFKHLFGGLE
ncbi:MAG: hypothetical protein HWN68_18680 [Desulfobacterales bacterium]|nr:hypothetical protein [Desulfobacterales bacterium]